MSSTDHTTRSIAQPAWWRRANCAGVDPELFFPDRGASTREAKAVCAACSVRDECLEDALTNSEKYGIWGGKSERERRRLRRTRATTARTIPTSSPVYLRPVPTDPADL